MKDWRGKTIKRGSIILYPGRKGSSIWVVEAEVFEVRNNEIIVQPIRCTEGFEHSKRPVSITSTERVTVLH